MKTYIHKEIGFWDIIPQTVTLEREVIKTREVERPVLDEEGNPVLSNATKPPTPITEIVTEEYTEKENYDVVIDDLHDGYDKGITLEDFYDGKYILLNADQLAFRTANPAASPVEVYNMAMTVIPEPTESELLQIAKDLKIAEANAYYNSDEINLISISGYNVYLDPDTRNKIKERIDECKFNGSTTDNFNFGDIKLENIEIALAEQMYFAVIKQYKLAYDALHDHIETINGLTTKADVGNYDIKLNYPNKLVL